MEFDTKTSPGYRSLTVRRAVMDHYEQLVIPHLQSQGPTTGDKSGVGSVLGQLTSDDAKVSPTCVKFSTRPTVGTLSGSL